MSRALKSFCSKVGKALMSLRDLLTFQDRGCNDENVNNRTKPFASLTRTEQRLSVNKSAGAPWILKIYK